MQLAFSQFINRILV